MSKSDPTGAQYYKPLATADKASDWLFYLAALLSIVILAIDRKTHQALYDAVQTAFILATIGVFLSGVVIRVYFWPRAENSRRKDLFTDAFDVPLTAQPSEGYYNSRQQPGLRRMLASFMESSFFTQKITGTMLAWQRAKIIIYFGLWIVAVMNRTADIGTLALIVQALFSEQIFSKHIRLEWLHRRAEGIYGKAHSLFLQHSSTRNTKHFTACALEIMAEYETAKASASIVLSSRIFNRDNAAITAQWDAVRSKLSL